MAKKITVHKPKPKAHIDFENELWEVTNELRGAGDELQEILNEIMDQADARYREVMA